MLAMLWADERGRIYDHPELEPVGASGREPLRLADQALMPLPDFSRLFYLPGCAPWGFDARRGAYARVENVRLGRRLVKAQAVAAFMAPGYVRTLLPGADYASKKVVLPMWGYSAVGLGGNGYVVPAFRIEENPTWDPANFDDQEVMPLLERRMAGRAGGWSAR